MPIKEVNHLENPGLARDPGDNEVTRESTQVATLWVSHDSVAYGPLQEQSALPGTLLF